MNLSNILFVITILLGIFLIFFYKKFSDNARVKLMKTLHTIGFIILILGFFFFDVNIKYKIIDIKALIIIPIMLITLSFHIKPDIKTKDKPQTLEEQIKKDLNIISHEKKYDFGKKLNWIGGLITPMFPFMTIINTTWKKRLSKEAIIHENVHLWYLQNGIFLKYFGLLFLFVMLLSLIKLNFLIPYLSILAVIFSLVYFEKITFNKTNEIGKKLKIKTRVWNNYNMINYFIIYSIQIGLIYGIINGIKYLINFVML